MPEKKLEAVVTLDDRASKKMQKIGKQTSGLSSGFLAMAKAGAAAAAAVGGALVAGTVALGKAALDSAAEFETMSVALRTSFQGNADEAAAAQKQITDFAAKTPFQLQEVMQGFIKLKNMGLDPSESALTSYGDTASAMGKSLNDMVEAVADAATGEFERLKEFGIRASSEGDRVKFTFQGVTTEVGKNSEEIEQYLIDLGKTKFAGGMASQAQTLTGLISTLKDNFSIALNTIATESGLLDVAKDAVAFLTENIENMLPFITDAVDHFKGFASQLKEDTGPRIEQIKKFLIELWERSKGPLTQLWQTIQTGIDTLKSASGQVGEDTGPAFLKFALDVIPKLIDIVNRLLPDLFKLIEIFIKVSGVVYKAQLAVINFVVNAVQFLIQVSNAAQTMSQRFIAAVFALPGMVGRAFAGIVDAIRYQLNRAIALVQGKVNQIKNTVAGVGNAISSPFKRIGGLFGLNSGGAVNQFGNVKRFANGGVVPGVGVTDSVPALLTPGEVVINPKKGQGLGSQITLNISNNSFSSRDDIDYLAAEVEKRISRQLELTTLGLN